MDSNFGFTTGEYYRSKANYLSNLEKRNNERDKQLRKFYIQQYSDHFLKNEPITSIEVRYLMMSQLVPDIHLESVNQIKQQLMTNKYSLEVSIIPR